MSGAGIVIASLVVVLAFLAGCLLDALAANKVLWTLVDGYERRADDITAELLELRGKGKP